MKVSRPIALATCLGFVVGFAVCLVWRIAGVDDEGATQNDSLSADVPLEPAPVVKSDESVSRNARPEPELFGHREITPRAFIPGQEWTVTIWYQSLPPQKGPTHDPREYVAERMGLKSR